jgi:hypothetical protein
MLIPIMMPFGLPERVFTCDALGPRFACPFFKCFTNLQEGTGLGLWLVRVESSTILDESLLEKRFNMESLAHASLTNAFERIDDSEQASI